MPPRHHPAGVLRESREQLEKFRAFGGMQSYPSRTKDPDEVVEIAAPDAKGLVGNGTLFVDIREFH